MKETLLKKRVEFLHTLHHNKESMTKLSNELREHRDQGETDLYIKKDCCAKQEGKRESMLRSIEDKDKGKSSSRENYRHNEDKIYHIKLLNIQGLSKTKVVEIECLV